MAVRRLTSWFLFITLTFNCTFAAPPPGKGGGNGNGGGEDPPAEETPAGTIYYQVKTASGDQTWGMDGDGENKFQALPQGVFGNPSSLLYGSGHRWWLVTAEDGRFYDRVIYADGTVTGPAAHVELFAVHWTNGELTWQQVCDSFGKFRFPPPPDGTFNGPRPDGGFLTQWSSEGMDHFVYSKGTDISATFLVEEDDTTTLDLRNGYNSTSLCRVDFPGGGTTLGQSIEAGGILGPDAVTIVPGVWQGSNVTDRHFSPDGQTILDEVDVFDPAANTWVLEHDLRDAATGNTLWTASLDARQSARWSPLGGEIAVSLGGDAEGIWTLLADATGFAAPNPLFLLGGKYNDATDPRWSPDAEHLVFRQSLWKKGKYRVHLYRIKRDGSGVVQLTGDLDDSRKWPFRWTSNLIAP